MSQHDDIMAAKPRRFVTGLNEDGASVFARIEEVDEVDYSVAYPRIAANPDRGIEIYRMWAMDSLPIQLPFDGRTAPIDAQPTEDETADALRRSSAQPRADGVRITLIKYPPGADKKPRMHWHDTFDVQWLISGELVSIMDDGSEVVMRPGDVVLQYGTRHDWAVRSPEGAVLALVQFGAERVGTRPPDDGFQDHTPEGMAQLARASSDDPATAAMDTP
jgi:quercetin dioxygenase-like cupin family protein